MRRERGLPKSARRHPGELIATSGADPQPTGDASRERERHREQPTKARALIEYQGVRRQERGHAHLDRS